MLKRKKIFLFLFFLVFCFGAKGQEEIFKNLITGKDPSDNNPFTSGQEQNANITVSGIGFGPGIASYSADDRYNTKGWNSSSLDETDYFTFKLTPISGFKIVFSSFVYSSQRSDTGPLTFALRSSVDGFTSNIGTLSEAGANINLSGLTFQNITSAIEFRLYCWGASSAGGTFSINDFTFNGNVVSMGCYVPDLAGEISGSTSVLPNQSGVSYSVSPISNATGYIWNLPPDASITDGDNTNSIMVDFGATSGNVSVYGINACGSGTVSPIVKVNVSNPVLYLHDFGSTKISTHPYNDSPVTFATHLSNSSWLNSVGSWTSFNGSLGQAIALDNSLGTPTIMLNFIVDPYFKLDITDFNFWRQRSPTGATNWSMAINETTVGSGINLESGTSIGQTAVSNLITNLTGTVNVAISLSGGTSSLGTFRLDDFTLYGIVECIPPIAPSNPISNSPQCADVGVKLIRSETPPANETWYWQTAADGTDTENSNETYTVYASGTYYLRSRNNISECWSEDVGSLEIVTIPNLPVSVSITADATTVCDGKTVSFIAEPINGGIAPNYQWQVNGADISGETNSAYSYNPVDGDKVTCVLSSNETCICDNPATSIEMTIKVRPIISARIFRIDVK